MHPCANRNVVLARGALANFWLASCFCFCNVGCIKYLAPSKDPAETASWKLGLKIERSTRKDSQKRGVCVFSVATCASFKKCLNRCASPP